MKVLLRFGLPCLVLGLVALVALPRSYSEDQSSSSSSSGPVKLQPMKWQQFKERLAANKDVRYTLVDVWATTCGPCKENFPHLVEMHHKYARKGLAVISLSLDDPTDGKAVAAAEKFLQEKKATFTNVLLDEEYGAGFDRLDINTIPAVFLFAPDGKEVKRFTMDDPNHQFTYEQVEKEVMARLDGAGTGTTASQ